MTCKGLVAVVYQSEAQNPPYPATNTVYVYTMYLFTQGKGERGGELNQREGERTDHTAGLKIP